MSHSFTKNFHFIDSVKAYLSYALLRACVSSSPSVFQVNIPFLLILNFIIQLFYNHRSLLYHKSIIHHYMLICLFIWFIFQQYAAGIFAVLLLRFRESLKVDSEYIVLQKSNFLIHMTLLNYSGIICRVK